MNHVVFVLRILKNGHKFVLLLGCISFPAHRLYFSDFSLFVTRQISLFLRWGSGTEGKNEDASVRCKRGADKERGLVIAAEHGRVEVSASNRPAHQ